MPIVWLFSACSSQSDTRFKELPSDRTGIDFENRVTNTPDFNIQNYLYFYDGGGVAAGDIDNDGLPDLFFVSNAGDHKLYRNLGEFRFEDVTEISGILGEEGSWTTGVTMADVNGDGYLDIYLSRVTYLTKSGANQLWINNGDGTFTDLASDYGLDFEGYSTQAAFFDYNGNGRLDLFLLNHSFHNENTYGRADQLRARPDPKAGDRLFRNDGNRFTDVTEQAGIISSALGYGLGLAVTDINLDGHPDIYVGNDFHEDDYFYINNGDETFTELLYSMVGHTSNSSMGNDIGDINNDGLPDIISLDMMPMDHETFLRSGGPDIMIVKEAKRNFGFGEKNNRNTLQVNRGFSPDTGLPVFSETAFSSGIARTDWSWASLFADFDNDGLQDLFVTNGMPGRPNDLDYVAALQSLRSEYSGQELDRRLFSLIESMPDVRVPNKMFYNRGDFTFADSTESWGFSRPGFSSGAVHADLDGDGLLDLAVSNINEPASIFQNSNGTAASESRNYLKIKLNGSGNNRTGIGSKVFLYSGDKIFYREQFPVRGFQSSVDHTLHFGLGSRSDIDSLLVVWPEGSYQVLQEPDLNRTLELQISDAEAGFDYSRIRPERSETPIQEVSDGPQIDYVHQENRFDDFYREPLVPYKQSRRGPATAVADVNGDGLDDFFAGGSRGRSAVLYIQQSDGSFMASEQEAFARDSQTEDVDAVFFDANSDGFSDLYVASGGYEYPTDSPLLSDRLYLNDGNGLFTRAGSAIPEHRVNSGVVRAADFNGDGHQDLFIGGHADPWKYGIGPRSVLLRNDGTGNFEDVTREMAPDILTIGNVTSAAWIDVPGKQLPDLVIAGEWMPIYYLENTGDRMNPVSAEKGLDGLSGLWQVLRSDDINGDGLPDLIAGNFGTNSRLQPYLDGTVTLYINDFDGNGQTEPLVAVSENGMEFPFEQLDELKGQITTIPNEPDSYSQFAGSSTRNLFGSDLLDEALQKELHETRSMVFLNTEEGVYRRMPLPEPAQWFPVMAIYPDDVDGDGHTDLILGGNILDVKPSYGGAQDAGHGLLLKGNGNGEFSSLPQHRSGFYAPGEIRGIESLMLYQAGKLILVIRNNDKPLYFTFPGTP
ncbi:VCBS repeat-containing protein [Rhodohalobacter mucosus]|uniref:VCBS repeat-containing protein n=1 Tax=Rhodohalobacter mucosus TaxID=2079485 RepID=UPI001304E6E2|nr:VCBS repeat-containing protein [Rhodohalobacter mucosus]